MVKVELFDDLDSVERDAAGALDRPAQACLHARLSWYRLLHDHCPPTGRLQVLRARNDVSAAWLFLAREGVEAKPYASWYSLRFDVAGDAGLADHLFQAARRRSAKIMLAPLPDPEPLLASLQRTGWAAWAEPMTGNWIARTGGVDFAGYWAKRPGKLRSTAQRKAKAAGLEVALYDRFDPASWAEYEAVYRASWKPEEGSFPFLRALAEQEGAAGTLRLGIARHHGRPVAAQLWIVENGVATIHKLAYAEDAKALSPGTVLSMEMFRHAIDRDRVAQIDYGTGDDPYKRDWMDERRQLWRIVACNPRTPRGFLTLARRRASVLVGRLRTR